MTKIRKKLKVKNAERLKPSAFMRVIRGNYRLWRAGEPSLSRRIRKWAP